MTWSERRAEKKHAKKLQRFVESRTMRAAKLGDYSTAMNVQSWVEIAGPATAARPDLETVDWDYLMSRMWALENVPPEEAKALWEGEFGKLPVLRDACWLLGDRGVARGVRSSDFKLRWQ